MDEQARLELFRQHRTGQQKYDYFLMALAGAAIAFSVQQTVNTSLSWYLLLLATAVICWCVSIFSGCRKQVYIDVITQANHEMLFIDTGSHPKVGSDPQAMLASTTGIVEAVEKNSLKCQKWGKRQFRFLLVGALFFLVWHVWRMALN